MAIRIVLNNYADYLSLAPANALTPMIFLDTRLLMTLWFIIAAVV